VNMQNNTHDSQVEGGKYMLTEVLSKQLENLTLSDFEHVNDLIEEMASGCGALLVCGGAKCDAG